MGEVFDRCDVFSDSIPPGNSGIGISLKRVGAGKAGEAIILSDALVCRRMHWWQGRSQPCTGVRTVQGWGGCEPCRLAAEGRWKAWIAIFQPRDGEISLLELTPGPAQKCVEARADFGTLRGLSIVMRRIGKKANGRLHATLSAGRYDRALLPDCPDVGAILLKMWGVDIVVSGFPFAAASEYDERHQLGLPPEISGDSDPDHEV